MDSLDPANSPYFDCLNNHNDVSPSRVLDEAVLQRIKTEIRNSGEMDLNLLDNKEELKCLFKSLTFEEKRMVAILILPPWMTTIPNFFKELTDIEMLKLKYTKIQELPEWIGEMPALNILILPKGIEHLPLWLIKKLNKQQERINRGFCIKGSLNVIHGWPVSKSIEGLNWYKFNEGCTPEVSNFEPLVQEGVFCNGDLCIKAHPTNPNALYSANDFSGIIGAIFTIFILYVVYSLHCGNKKAYKPNIVIKKEDSSKRKQQVIQFVSDIIKISNLYQDYTYMYSLKCRVIKCILGESFNKDKNLIKWNKKVTDQYKKINNFDLDKVGDKVSSLYRKMQELGKIHKINPFLFPELISKAKALIGSCIGEQDTVDAGVFEKFGIICIKNNTPLTHSLPNNIITEAELLVMTCFLKKIGDRKKCLFQFSSDCDEEFKEKTIDNFVKILTFPQGRKLIGDLIWLMIQKNKKIFLHYSKDAAYSKAYGRYGKQEISISHKTILYESFNEKTRKLSLHIKPSWVGFPHELIHFLHELQLVKDDNYKLKIPDERWTNGEELKTIGHPEKIAELSAQELKDSLTENAFLREAAYPLRIYHEAPLDHVTKLVHVTKLMLFVSSVVSTHYFAPLVIAYCEENLLKPDGHPLRLYEGSLNAAPLGSPLGIIHQVFMLFLSFKITQYFFSAIEQKIIIK